MASNGAPTAADNLASYNVSEARTRNVADGDAASALIRAELDRTMNPSGTKPFTGTRTVDPNVGGPSY